MDPALPLISERIRLKRKAADHVHVIQTNAGYYGDIGSIGDVNICVNNGNIQPFCKESNGNAQKLWQYIIDFGRFWHEPLVNKTQLADSLHYERYPSEHER